MSQKNIKPIPRLYRSSPHSNSDRMDYFWNPTINPCITALPAASPYTSIPHHASIFGEIASNKTLEPQTVAVPNSSNNNVVSVNHNYMFDPKWSHSLMRTDQGIPVLKMVPKELILQEQKRRTWEDYENCGINPNVLSSGSSMKSSVFSNDSGFESSGMITTMTERPAFNTTATRVTEKENLVIFPLAFPSPPINPAGAGGVSLMLPTPLESIPEEKVFAMITMEKEFLREICTGEYPADYIVCDLLLPPPMSGKSSNNYYSRVEGVARRQGVSNMSMARSCKTLLTPNGRPEATDFSKVPKACASDPNRVKLTNLPCCTELPLEMSCISSVNMQSKPNAHTTAVDSDKILQLPQFIRNNQIDEFDEIQHQFDAISFTKPEILTSSATLASLNSGTEPPIDDILRRHEITANGAIRKDKLSFSMQKEIKNKGYRCKPIKKTMHNNYIPRGPLPFARCLDLPCPSKPNAAKKQPKKTAVKRPSLSQSTPSTSLMPQPPTRKRKLLKETQQRTEILKSKLSTICNKTSDVKINPGILSSPLINLSVSKKKNGSVSSSGYPLKRDLQYLQEQGSVVPKLPLPSMAQLQPKRKSQFDWVDGYFKSKK